MSSPLKINSLFSTLATRFARCRSCRIVLSLLILGISSVYIYAHIPSHWTPQIKEMFSLQFISYIAMGSFILSASCVFLASGWYWLMVAYLAPTLGFFEIGSEYASSYFLRYIGGFWGSAGIRHLRMNQKYQIAHKSLLVVALGESAMLLSGSTLLCFSLIVEEIVTKLKWDFSSANILTTALLSFMIVAVVFWLVRSTKNHRALLYSFGCYLAYIVLNTAVFVWLFKSADGSPLYKAAVYNFGWIMGQLTPGAVQGLGIREAISISFLTSPPQVNLLFWIICFRLMSLGGDILFYMISRAYAHYYLSEYTES